LCNGAVVPSASRLDTVIEYAHRLTSGLALLAVIGLAVWAFRAYPPGDRVRRVAVASFLFIIAESLLGAALVLFGWTAMDTSTFRVFIQPVHMVNTLILLAAVLFTAWWASGGGAVQLAGQGRRLWLFAGGVLGVLVMSASGAVISLGDLLAISLGERHDALVAVLVQLRLGHPAIAIASGLYLLWLAFRPEAAPNARAQRLAYLAAGLVLAQWLVGFVNVLLRVPLWTQVLHLFLADAIWIVLLLWAASALAKVEAPAAAPGSPRPLGRPAGAG
jgi:heme A synthase